MILDTNFLIDFEEEVRLARVGVARVFLGTRRSTPALVTVVSFGELAAGMNNNEQAIQFLSRWKILNLHRGIAEAASDIDREQMQTGQRLSENDNWIAGFSRALGQPVVSNDQAFDRVHGLRRIAY